MAEIGDSTSLRREDINDFPPQTIKLILQVQSKGWRAVRSNRNHVMLLAPDGESRFSASRNSNSWKFLKEDIARYERAHPTVQAVETVATERWSCPRPECNKVYTSMDQLNAHIQADHEGLVKCPDCVHTAKNQRLLNLHRSKAHGYESPAKAGRLAAEAKRKRKTEQPAPVVLPAPAPVEPEPVTIEEPTMAEHNVDLIDERNSWTIDLSKVMGQEVAQLQAQLAIAGLNMEIRVWRDS